MHFRSDAAELAASHSPKAKVVKLSTLASSPAKAISLWVSWVYDGRAYSQSWQIVLSNWRTPRSFCLILRWSKFSEFALSYIYFGGHWCAFCSIPDLERCQVYNPDLVDPLLMRTYRGIPRLPRYFHLQSSLWISPHFFFISMADYAPTWGQQSKKGGFFFHRSMLCTSPPTLSKFFTFFLLLFLIMCRSWW